MLEPADVVDNFVGVCPLIASYLKETGRKDDGDSLVVRSPSLIYCHCVVPMSVENFDVQKNGMDGYFYPDQLARLKFRVFHMLLEKCKYIGTFHF